MRDPRQKRTTRKPFLVTNGGDESGGGESRNKFRVHDQVVRKSRTWPRMGSLEVLAILSTGNLFLNDMREAQENELCLVEEG